MWYDTDVVILYQSVIKYNRPIQYLFYNGRNFDDYFQLITNELRSGQSLISIGNKYSYISVLDLSMISIAIVIEYNLTGNINLDDIENIIIGVDPDKLLFTGINEFRKFNELEFYDSIDDLAQTYVRWRNDYQESLKQDITNAQALLPAYNNSILNILDKYSPLPSDSLTMTQITFETHPIMNSVTTRLQLKGETTNSVSSITPNDGLILFNESKLSFNVPYIQFNGEPPPMANIKKRDLTTIKIRKLYKVYQSQKLFLGGNDTNYFTDQPLNYGRIIPSTDQTNDPNTIYMIILVPTNGEIIQNSILLIEYNLETNTLIAKTPVKNDGIKDEDRQLIINLITSALPINITTTTDIKASGFFHVYNAEFDYPTFLFSSYLSIIDPGIYPLSQFLYMDESQLSYATKIKINMQFTSLPQKLRIKPLTGYLKDYKPEVVTIASNFLNDDKTINVKINGSITPTIMKKNTPYLKISITKSKSNVEAQRIVDYMSRMLNPYQQALKYIRENFLKSIDGIDILYSNLSVISPITPITPITSTTPIISRKGKSRWTLLKEEAPELYINSRGSVQKITQPLIIGTDEVTKWENTMIQTINGPIKRPIITFPKDHDPNLDPGYRQWNFVCPDDDYPYIGLIENKQNNKDKYPYVPSCFKSNHTITGANSKYNEYYHDTVKRLTTTSNYVIRGNKLLINRQLGKLNPALFNILNIFQPGEYRHRGVIRSTNSLIHSCLFALITTNYQPPPSINVNDWRSYLSFSIDDKEIFAKRIRADMASIIKPELLKQEFYDFDLNTITDYLRKSNRFFDPKVFYRAVEEYFNINIFVFSFYAKDENTISYMELPRALEFPIRVENLNRSSILIYKYWGSDSDQLKYPQCELIQNETTYIFPPDISKKLYNVFYLSSQTISWNATNHHLISRLPFYHIIDYSLLFPNAIGQYIDKYGKMRGLVINLNNVEIGIYFPPAQPLNLSSVNRLISPPPLNTVLQAFQNNILTAVTRIDPNNPAITGLWVKILDITFGIYIPVEPTIKSEYSDMPIGPINPYLITGINMVDRINHLQRTLKIILQLTNWVYMLSKLSADNFINNYMIKQSMTEDSDKIYDWSKLPPRLPKLNNVNEGINYIKSVFPSLILNNILMMYNGKFFNGITYFLREREKLSKGLKLPLPTLIDGVFQEPIDFKQQLNVIIFVDQNSLINWLNNDQRDKHELRTIRDKFDYSLSALTQPYMYQDEDKKIYLIQKVLDGNLIRALTLGKLWYTKKINTGYDTIKESFPNNKLPDYVVYHPATDGKLVVIEDNYRRSHVYLQVLNYGRDIYSAMLPIL